MIDKVFNKLQQKFFKDRRRTTAYINLTQQGYIYNSHGHKKTQQV